jgi:chromate reductase, NAD(P)H dehydrogenase (quinone)
VNTKKIIALNGSTRKISTNANLIQAIINLTSDRFKIDVYSELTELPHFNPDLDNENPPEKIKQWRETLRKYDGILICTPEYAMGVPGTLKNAIDWTVSSMEFSKKPTALITASSLGLKGHDSLLETLKVIEAKITGETQLVISYARTKVTIQNNIIDPATKNAVVKLLNDFDSLLEQQGNLLSTPV